MTPNKDKKRILLFERFGKMSVLNILSGKAMVLERDCPCHNIARLHLHNLHNNKPARVFSLKEERHKQAFLFYIALIALFCAHLEPAATGSLT